MLKSRKEKMKTSFLSILCFLPAFLLTLPAMALELARDGKTEYVIVRAHHKNYSTSRLIEATAKDLASLLKKSTGADFPIVTILQGKKHKKRIFLGESYYTNELLEKAGRWKELKNEQIRILTCGNDLYLYGGGHGNAFAAYRFLTKNLGFRFFHYWGDSYIPRYKVLKTGKLDSLFQPAFEYRDLAQSSFNVTGCKTHGDYFRRNMLHNNSLHPFHHLGGITHTYTKLIPPTKNHPQAYRFLKGKAYFVTNPEFFPLDAKGKRVTRGHRCFSNEQLRVEMNKNVEKLITERKGIQNTDSILVNISHDDIDCKFCYCEKCVALEKKYKAPGGPLYDYLIHSASPYFAKKYPNLVIRFLAYGRLTTEIPPAPETLKGGKMPANLMPHLAFLTADFNKSFDAPSNAFIYKCLTSWGRVAQRISFYFYPSTYGRPMIQFPLFGNTGRAIKDLQLGAKNNVTQIFCDYASLHRHCNTAFSGILNYVMARIYEEGPALDVEKTIDEYMKAIYKKAAPGMRKFYHELHALAAKDPTFVRWFPDPRVVNYLTPRQLYKWHRDFDAMEKAVAKDPRALLHVRGERLCLDAMTLLLYKEFSYAGYSKDYPAEKLYRRALATGLEAIKRSWNLKPEQGRPLTVEGILKQKGKKAPERLYSYKNNSKDTHNILSQYGYDSVVHTLGLYYKMAAYKEKLPAGFGNVPEKDRYYIFFARLKAPPEEMKDAPFGYALPANLPAGMTATYDFVRSPADGGNGRPLKVSNATSKFEYHFLTRTTFTPTSCMGAPRKQGFSSRYLGAYGHYAICSFAHLYDPKNPKQEWDIYASLKFGEKEMATSHLLLVKVVPGRKPFLRKKSAALSMEVPSHSIIPSVDGRSFPAEDLMGDLSMRNSMNGKSGKKVTLKGAFSNGRLFLLYREKEAEKGKKGMDALEIFLPGEKKYPVTHLAVDMNGKSSALSWTIPVTANPDDMKLVRNSKKIPFPGKAVSTYAGKTWTVKLQITLPKAVRSGEKLNINIFRTMERKSSSLALSPIYVENYLDGLSFYGFLYRDRLVLKGAEVKAPSRKDGICIMDGNSGWAISATIPFGLDPAARYIVSAYLRSDAGNDTNKVKTRIGVYNQRTKKITGYAVRPVMSLAGKEFRKVSSGKAIELPMSSMVYVGGFLPNRKLKANMYLKEFVIEKGK